jgi:hypothetical protein
VTSLDMANSEYSKVGYHTFLSQNGQKVRFLTLSSKTHEKRFSAQYVRFFFVETILMLLKVSKR